MAYVTKQEVRDEGVASSVTDGRLDLLIAQAQADLERWTGLWFEKRSGLTLKLDGSDAPILELPAPALAITSVKIDSALVDATAYVNYNRPPEVGADDYWYPRLVFREFFGRLDRAFGQGKQAHFPRGEQNVEVIGDFGFVEAGDKTPTLIKRATILLVIRRLALAAAAGPDKSLIRSETLGEYSYTLSNAESGGPSGVVEIDTIVAQYVRAGGMHVL
jgi:hypothetical protein